MTEQIVSNADHRAAIERARQAQRAALRAAYYADTPDPEGNVVS